MVENIITEVLQKMQGKINQEDSKTLETVLYAVLCKFDITEKTTELSTVDHAWETDLKRFLVRKHVDGKSDRTLETYKYHLARLLRCLNKPIDDITEGDLIKYITMYKETRSVGNRYMEDIRLVFRTFFGWQLKKGYIKKDPSYGLEPIKYPKVIKKPFSDEELIKLKQNCRRERDLAIIEFLYSTGVRVSELVSLNRKDINLDSMDVIVYGKGSKERQTYLTPASCYHLKEYFKIRQDDSEALFVSAKRPYERLSVSGVEQLLRTIGHYADVEKVHPHKFRRTIATNALNKGMPLEEVRDLLGHTKLDTTMIYCTVNKDSVRYSHRKLMCG